MDAKSEYDATHSLPPKDTTSEVISNSIVLNSFKLNINPTHFFRPLFQRLQWKMHKPRRSSLHLQRRFSHLYTIALAKFVFRQPAQRQQRRTIHPRRFHSPSFISSYTQISSFRRHVLAAKPRKCRSRQRKPTAKTQVVSQNNKSPSQNHQNP